MHIISTQHNLNPSNKIFKDANQKLWQPKYLMQPTPASDASNMQTKESYETSNLNSLMGSFLYSFSFHMCRKTAMNATI